MVGDGFTSLTVDARGGHDQLHGGEGDDQLFGDTLSVLEGRGGDDRLDGGAGNDLLAGDAPSLGSSARGGDDTFAFAGVFGDDRVLDFRQGEDRLEFSVPGVTGIDDVAIGRTGDDTLITVRGFGTVTLVGFDGTLGGADIVFA